jgi:16S rRNA (cytidine1402-2'-O)-methyltransferase
MPARRVFPIRRFCWCGRVQKPANKVETLPGATAFVPALINSGLPANRFRFEGFLPLKKGRQTLLKSLAEEERTILFYESPLRLVKTLEELIPYFGADRRCCVCRELTKLFEETKRGTLQEVADYFKTKQLKARLWWSWPGKNKAEADDAQTLSVTLLAGMDF